MTATAATRTTMRSTSRSATPSPRESSTWSPPGTKATISRPTRRLPPETADLADSLMADLPHVTASDRAAVEEAAAVILLIDRIDAVLAGRIAARGQVRALLDIRVRLSGRLERWLAALGATPQA